MGSLIKMAMIPHIKKIPGTNLLNIPVLAGDHQIRQAMLIMNRACSQLNGQ